MVAEADGARGRRGRHGVVVLLDVVDGRDNELVGLGGQGRVEAGKELLGRDEGQVPALGRDGDGRGERRGDLGGRHGDGLVGVVVGEVGGLCSDSGQGLGWVNGWTWQELGG